MAIATGTAIALGISAAGTAASFAQAGKQNRLAKDAQTAADKAFKEAEEQLNVNYMKELSIAKQPYEIQRERLAQVAGQAIDVGAESERMAGATAGRVLAQAQKAEQDITSRQIAEQQALEQLVATEERDLGSKRANLSLEQAAGAGIAAAQAQNLSNQAVAQGIQGLGNMAMIGVQSSELYPQGNTTIGDTDLAVDPVTLNPVSSPTSIQTPATSLPQQPIVPQSLQLPIQGNFQPPVQSQNMILNPAEAFLYSGVNGSGLNQLQYLNTINPLR